MRDEAARRDPHETGGVLLGYWADAEVVVADIVGPGPDALHGPMRFVPDTEYQEVEIARRYEASGRVVTYLGDWHTHPRGPGGISRLDLRTLHTIAREPAARAPVPVMLVVFDGEPWRVAAWIWAPRRIGLLATIRRASAIPIELYEGG
jgi:integrative and conjugative element protein (TIGR02256 family)